ncbi:unnamed protein product [Toxocara canis]|uniref:Polyhomeotic homolog 1 n=1 Tax=Toxocara canis TaxID=6265 RepID=A0A183UUE9_TOXCA|nr:unnamed protein product [Toxocara canis]
MSSSSEKQTPVATTSGQAVLNVGSLPMCVQSAHNSPELANMTVAQLLGQTQRRISVTHMNSVTGRVNSGRPGSISHPLSAEGGGGTAMSQAQQQIASKLSTTPSEQTQICQPYLVST